MNYLLFDTTIAMIIPMTAKMTNNTIIRQHFFRRAFDWNK